MLVRQLAQSWPPGTGFIFQPDIGPLLLSARIHAFDDCVLFKGTYKTICGTMQSQPATIIEIRPYRNGWKVFEAPGVEPVFLEKDQAINYAENRPSFRSGEIRILDSEGTVERTIPFSEADRKL
jgi:hypothetical protein